MLDVNEIIVNNIKNELKKADKTQDELACATGISKDRMNIIMNGTRMINRFELEKISKYFNISIESLMATPKNCEDSNVIDTFIKRANTEEARKGIKLADEIADLICFHSKCQENGEHMMQPWDNAENIKEE